jgi:hypothetical protein
LSFQREERIIKLIPKRTTLPQIPPVPVKKPAAVVR